MKTAIALATACAIGLTLSSGATGTTQREQAACGPKASILLWPKGYKAYPLPNFEMFRGWAGPFGVSNLLTYAAATKDGTLGYPSTHLDPGCLNYGATAKLAPGTLDGKASAAVRLACKFPKAVTIQIDNRDGYAKRVRVVLAPNTVVADATVAAHGSTLKYAKRYCAKKLPLIEPTS